MVGSELGGVVGLGAVVSSGTVVGEMVGSIGGGEAASPAECPRTVHSAAGIAVIAPATSSRRLV